MNYNKLNRELLLSGFLFAFFVWLIYIGISFIISGKTVLTTNGIVYGTGIGKSKKEAEQNAALDAYKKRAK